MSIKAVIMNHKCSKHHENIIQYTLQLHGNMLFYYQEYSFWIVYPYSLLAETFLTNMQYKIRVAFKIMKMTLQLNPVRGFKGFEHI